MSDERGIYRKFEVTRIDGLSAEGQTHHECRYFVLDLDHDEHAPSALEAYANDCEQERPQLAADLRTWLLDRKLMDGLYNASWER